MNDRSKIYIVTLNNKVVWASFNCKSCYDFVQDSIRDYEKKKFISYAQLTRWFKKGDEFVFRTAFETVVKFERFPVRSNYEKFLRSLKIA